MLNQKKKKEFTGFILLISLFIILTLGLFFIQSLFVILSLLIGVFLIITFFYNPKFGVLFFLIIRPIIDKQGEKIEIPTFISNITINSSAFLSIIFIILAVFFLIKEFFLSKKQYKYQNLIFIAWLVFIIFSIISLFYSIDKFSSFYEITRIITIFLFFTTALILTEEDADLDLFLKALLFSALIPFVVAIFQLITGSGMAGTSIGLDSRLYGTFSHPNQFASFALIIFGLSWFLYQQKNKINKHSWLPLATTLTLLIATFSRGAWLGIIIFSFIIGFLKNFKIIIGVFAILIILFITSETVHKRIEDIYNPPATSSVYWRMERWKENYQSFSQRPLFGHGSGTELKVYEKDYGFYSNNNYTHNDILKNAIEIGIIGTITYLILIITTFFTLIKIYLKTKNSLLKNFSLVLLAIFIAENVFSMTSNIFRGTATQWTLWFLIGACVGLYLKNCNKSKQK